MTDFVYHFSRKTRILYISNVAHSQNLLRYVRKIR